MEIKSKKDFVKVLFDLIEDEHVSFDIYWRIVYTFHIAGS